MPPQEKYTDLLNKISKEFDKSDIKIKQEKANAEWNYALCATPIQKNKGLILGINWGGNEKNYEISKIMPNGNDVKTYPFIKRSKSYLETYFHINIEEVNFNYSNFCFFRSPKANDLSSNDFNLCLPIIKEYIDYIQPPWILSLGTGNIKYLKKYFKTDFECSGPIRIEGNSNKAYKGSLMKFNFYNLPHPNAYYLSNDVYKKLWEKIFNSKNDNE